MNWFRFKSCAKCGGDLVLDQGDWLCMQCGTYYYVGLYQQPSNPEEPNPQPPNPPAQKGLDAVPSGPNASLNLSLAVAPEVNRNYGSAWRTDRVFNATQMGDSWAET